MIYKSARQVKVGEIIDIRWRVQSIVDNGDGTLTFETVDAKGNGFQIKGDGSTSNQITLPKRSSVNYRP